MRMYKTDCFNCGKETRASRTLKKDIGVCYVCNKELTPKRFTCFRCGAKGSDCFSKYKGKWYCKVCTLTALPHSIFKEVKPNSIK